eukprot:59860-Rhodomonas_salina.3
MMQSSDHGPCVLTHQHARRAGDGGAAAADRDVQSAERLPPRGLRLPPQVRPRVRHAPGRPPGVPEQPVRPDPQRDLAAPSRSRHPGPDAYRPTRALRHLQY